ncbi:MAG: hypothetical protein KDA85_08450, partial [Planctomycetaceae bacterium]|nr:hypothetical protein [Planctomycetaceae bacterium]
EFGIHWLRRFKPPEMTDWDAFRTSLHWPLRPSRARGDLFQEDARLAAGLSPDFIQELRDWEEPVEE